jgi:hypothetical protein
LPAPLDTCAHVAWRRLKPVSAERDITFLSTQARIRRRRRRSGAGRVRLWSEKLLAAIAFGDPEVSLIVCAALAGKSEIDLAADVC